MKTSLTFNEDNLGVLLNPFGGFDLERVQLLSALVDETGLLPYLTKWRAEDRAISGPGGRPAVVNDRTILILLLGMALLSKPLHVTLMAEAVTRSMTPEAREFLGLPQQRGTYIEWYNRIWRSIHTTFDVVEPFPVRGSARKRLTPEQYQELLDSRDPETVRVKQERIDFVANTLLETTWLCIPREIRRKYNGNTSVDATVVKAFGQRGHSRDGSFVAMETGAAWWLHAGDHKDRGGKRSVFGNDAHLVVTMGNDAMFEPEFPIVALAISFDNPGCKIAENTVKAYQSLAQRGHAPGLIVGDLAYASGQTPEKFHEPLIALGHEFVTDYKVNQLGNQLQHEGAIFVEGQWYCPCMEKNLIDATKDLFARKIDVDTWRRRIKARERYAAVRNGKPDSDGYYRMSHPTVAGKSVCNPNRKHIPKFCRQKSVTFPPSVGIKFRQPIPFGSDKWLSTYGHGRNCVETFNAYAKDESKQALGSQSRRRIRGYGAQYFMTVVLVAAANMRKIQAFLVKKRIAEARDAKNGVKTRAKRRDPSLSYFRKRKDPSTADASDGPPTGPSKDWKPDPEFEPLAALLDE